MSLSKLLNQLEQQPETVQFNDVMDVIAHYYTYQPVSFSNGIGEDTVTNDAGTNEGSCKLFAFAQLQGLDEPHTLHCFGHYYREDVLGNPDGEDHANIRGFMRHGWAGIQFSDQALTAKP